MTPEEATGRLFEVAKANRVGDICAVAKAALAAGADVNAKDHVRLTPLHCAAANGYADLARLLVENGADLSAKNKWQQTPLHWAAQNGHTGIVNMLKEVNNLRLMAARGIFIVK